MCPNGLQNSIVPQPAMRRSCGIGKATEGHIPDSTPLFSFYCQTCRLVGALPDHLCQLRADEVIALRKECLRAVKESLMTPSNSDWRFSE